MSFADLANTLSSTGMNLNFGSFKFNIPSLTLFNDSIETPGVGTFCYSSGSLVQMMTNGARGVFCIGAILTDPQMLLNVLRMCGEYILAHGLALINDIYKTCIARINNILSSVYGIVLGYFKTIKNVIKAIQGLADLWDKICDAWNSKSSGIFDKIFDKENCDFMVANLMRCMMSKLLEPYLTKLKLNIQGEINDFAGEIDNEIHATTQPLTSMSSYLDNQATYVNKFTAQVSEIL